MTDTHSESPRASKASAKERALIVQMKAAARDGRLKRGVLDIEPTSEEAFDDLELAGQQYARSRARGETTVPITIRMDPQMVEELRERAEQLGVRGYQTLIKKWIQEKLTNAPQISAEDLAAMPLGSVALMLTAMAGGHHESPEPQGETPVPGVRFVPTDSTALYDRKVPISGTISKPKRAKR